MTINPSIVDFVDSFWPLNTFCSVLPKTYDEHISNLRNCCDGRLIDRLDMLVKQRDKNMENGSDGIIEYQEIINIVFENRIHEIWTPTGVRASRTALSLLLQELQSVQTPFSLLDAGCGSGMVDIGLALRLPQLQHVYAVDRSAEALDVFRENIGKKIPERREMFTLLNHDYTGEGFRALFKELEPEGVPYVVSVFPFGGESHILNIFPHFLSQNGAILSCVSIQKYGCESTSWEEFMDCIECESARNALMRYGLKWRRADYVQTEQDVSVELVRVTRWNEKD